MGRICCVPLCPSKTGTTGLHFHEIPSDKELREKWLKVISRADSKNCGKRWVPGSRSAACSRHFVDSDYQTDYRGKRLKNDAIPSVFPEYPSHKLQHTKPRKMPTMRDTCPTQPKRRKLREINGENGCILPVQQENHATVGHAHVQTDPEPITESMMDKRVQNWLSEKDRVIKALKARINVLKCTVQRKDKIIIGLRSENAKETAKLSELHQLLDQLQEGADRGEVKAILLIEQLRAYGKTRFRWSELCIRMCILWRNKSPRAYIFARRYFVNLPCYSTLKNYVGPSSLETGLTQLAVVRLKEELNNIGPMETFCSLIFDEMALTPRMQYNRQADKIVGVAEIGKGASSNFLANKLLCFVLKGLSTNYRIPVAYFLACQLQGNDLSKLILDILNEIEKLGFRVCRLVCDDATTNVKALENICNGELRHCIQHPVRPQDPFFISFDQCHILKNLRNQFLDENRTLNNNNELISSKPLKLLYENQKLLPIKPVRFLTRKMVYPTNFEKMNVKRAIQIFSSEVTSALEFCQNRKLPGFKDIQGTLEFMKMVRKWFLMHNVCNKTHYITSRESDRRHFGILDDERLQWLECDFTNYINSWKAFADNLSGNKRTNKHFLTKETYTALMITTRSTVACIRYLIQSGFHYVLTRKFSSDDVEGIFSAVRSYQGYNDQANAVGSIYALETILKTGLFSTSAYGNSKLDDIVQLSCRNTKINIIGHKMPSGELITLNQDQMALVERLKNPPLVLDVTVKNAGVAMVAGFLLRLLKDRHSCSIAGKDFTGSADEDVSILVSLQDRGGLINKNSYHLDALVKSWKLTLISLLPDSVLLCGCNDAFHTKHVRDLIIGSLCKIYFTNVSMNVTNVANEKPKFVSKPASKKIKKM